MKTEGKVTDEYTMERAEEIGELVAELCAADASKPLAYILIVRRAGVRTTGSSFVTNIKGNEVTAAVLQDALFGISMDRDVSKDH